VVVLTSGISSRLIPGLLSRRCILCGTKSTSYPWTERLKAPDNPFAPTPWIIRMTARRRRRRRRRLGGMPTSTAPSGRGGRGTAPPTLPVCFDGCRLSSRPPRPQVQVLSFAAYDAHQVTWCCIRKLCTNSGEGRYNFFLTMPIICISLT
jgi:hypothetical protein